MPLLCLERHAAFTHDKVIEMHVGCDKQGSSSQNCYDYDDAAVTTLSQATRKRSANVDTNWEGMPRQSPAGRGSSKRFGGFTVQETGFKPDLV